MFLVRRLTRQRQQYFLPDDAKRCLLAALKSIAASNNSKKTAVRGDVADEHKNHR